MKASIFFHIGAALSGIFFLIVLVNSASSIAILQGQPGSEYSWRMVWAVLILAVLIGLAFWLKSLDKLLPATILIWLPALPLLLWGGLAALFVVHDIFYK